eukprot:4526436-Prorocentrum_lima.AAC.1
MTSSLVGSEMCIRDSHCTSEERGRVDCSPPALSAIALQRRGAGLIVHRPVSYTHLTLPTICSV